MELRVISSCTMKIEEKINEKFRKNLIKTYFDCVNSHHKRE